MRKSTSTRSWWIFRLRSAFVLVVQ